jgi:GH15 family glucan-1,4-alpha-glucosidase
VTSRLAATIEMQDAPPNIEDYALIGNRRTAALVSKEGSIDWFCVGRFDQPACFARLLGTVDNGRWLITPAGAVTSVSRCYLDDTMILQTNFVTADGEARLIDFMPVHAAHSTIIRIVEGVSGRVAMRLHLTIRLDYGISIPWVTRAADGCGVRAVVGPDALMLRGPVAIRGEGMATVADFAVDAGQRLAFELTHSASYQPPAPHADGEALLADTRTYWAGWSARCGYDGPYRPAVMRSLLTLKALSYEPTGGIVAAPTTSLPEQLGGPRNWDYRFCWLRDASLTLLALLHAGYTEEADAWRGWLQRAVAGAPEQIQIMYGIAGERHLSEWEVDWLPGYQGAKPVRIGNAAAGQLQLDVYGEVMDAIYQSRRAGLGGLEVNLEHGLIAHLADIWQQPDEGVWEVRGGRRHFVSSKVMAWCAVDRAVRLAEEFGIEGPVADWRVLRDRIHADVCAQGFDAKRGAFVQYYGSSALDASTLVIPLVGFLPPDDPRVVGTVKAIGEDLIQDGFVLRYHAETGTDGLPGGEGTFLACSFWYADNLILQGRRDEAGAMYERLIGLANDVGLLSEEYDVPAKRLVGNFPQAFSHIGVIGTALNLRTQGGPAHDRADGGGKGAG